MSGSVTFHSLSHLQSHSASMIHSQIVGLSTLTYLRQTKVAAAVSNMKLQEPNVQLERSAEARAC